MEHKVTIKLRVDNLLSYDVKMGINEVVNNTDDWSYKEDEIGNHFQKDVSINEQMLDSIKFVSNKLHNENKINHVIDIQATLDKHGWLYNKRITH